MHGFRSSVDNSKARFFLNHAHIRGYSLTNFDLPCHGRSEGKLRDFRVSTALAALIEVIHQFRDTPIVLLGSSMGAWLSMLAARKLANSADVNIAGAVLIAPAFDFVEQYFNNEPVEVLRQWRRDGFRKFIGRYDNQPYELGYALVEDGLRHNMLNKTGEYDFPIRIFHGCEDDVVPIDLSRQFRSMSVNSDIVVRGIKDGDHTLNQQLPLIAAELDNIFGQVRVQVQVQAQEPEAVSALSR